MDGSDSSQSDLCAGEMQVTDWQRYVAVLVTLTGAYMLFAYHDLVQLPNDAMFQYLSSLYNGTWSVNVTVNATPIISMEKNVSTKWNMYVTHIHSPRNIRAHSTSILIVGDSHAHWVYFGFVRNSARLKGVPVHNYAEIGCSHVWGVHCPTGCLHSTIIL